MSKSTLPRWHWNDHQRVKRHRDYIGTFRACHAHLVQQAFSEWQRRNPPRSFTLETETSFRTNAPFARPHDPKETQRPHYFLFMNTDCMVDNGMIRGSNEYIRSRARMKRTFYHDYLFPLLQEQRKTMNAARRAAKTPSKPKPKAHPKPTARVTLKTAHTQSIEWFSAQLAGTLTILSEHLGVSLEEVVSEMGGATVRALGLDGDGLECFAQDVLRGRQEAKRQLILSAAKKLSRDELAALGISDEASSILDGTEEEECDD